MRFNFFKSFNLGHGFRLNLSKRGLGASWGYKGFRISATPGGKSRKKRSKVIKSTTKPAKISYPKTAPIIYQQTLTTQQPYTRPAHQTTTIQATVTLGVVEFICGSILFYNILKLNIVAVIISILLTALFAALTYWALLNCESNNQ